MDKVLRTYLQSRKSVQISLSELQSIFPGETDYSDFANLIKQFEAENILKPVKKHNTNNKSIPLYHTYRINKSYFKDRLLDHIQSTILKVHESLNLQTYFSLDEKTWKKDLPFIKKIDQYIKGKGFPKNEASAPERSYEMIGDEKWIDLKGGKALLQRIGIWDKLKITYNVDPLMAAINPKMINQSEHLHLVVENKATFYDCLESLEDTSFTSLIYGAGWKIVCNIAMLDKQLGIEGSKSKIYYFGDLDYEGISIWYMLREKDNINLAVPFYQALLSKVPTPGKVNQRKNSEALEQFISCFSKEEEKRIETLLESGCYYPQEGLSKAQIKKVWRGMEWNLE